MTHEVIEKDAKGRPLRADGILGPPAGIEEPLRGDGRCVGCGGGLNAITGRPGVELCRECARAFAVSEKLDGSVYHLREIVWNDKHSKCVPHCDFYMLASLAWHPGRPEAKAKCQQCGGAK